MDQPRPARYRKKSTAVVTAEVFNVSDPLHWPDGVFKTGTGYAIKAMEGIIPVPNGSYILTGARGEKWPVDPGVFAETYELVE